MSDNVTIKQLILYRKQSLTAFAKEIEVPASSLSRYMGDTDAVIPPDVVERMSKSLEVPPARILGCIRRYRRAKAKRRKQKNKDLMRQTFGDGHAL